MRSLKQYIVESVHTYNYTIKVAGEVNKNFLDLFIFNLKKFEPVNNPSISSTPIQKSPYGFPNMSNVPVTIIKCEFRYPATEPMIQQIAQLLGYNLNAVRVMCSDFDDGVNTESEEYQNQMKQDPLLTKEEMGSAPNAKDANKAYSNCYLDSIKDQTKDDKLEIPYEGKKTPDSYDPFKPETYMASMGKESPMSNIKRPAKPKTGASFVK